MQPITLLLVVFLAEKCVYCRFERLVLQVATARGHKGGRPRQLDASSLNMAKLLSSRLKQFGYSNLSDFVIFSI